MDVAEMIFQKYRGFDFPESGREGFPPQETLGFKVLKAFQRDD